MAHYTGPKAKVNRRLGVLVFEDGGATRAYQRREGQPPGMHGSGAFRSKSSTYGMALKEKQKIKYYYGLGERQLRRMFRTARQTTGNTGQELLLLCERRLDNIVRRAGLALTRPQARQGIAHGHFLVNGRKTDKPSFMVRAGDVITVKNRKNLLEIYRGIVESGSGEVLPWLAVDSQELKITVNCPPESVDISLPVDVDMVVELLSR